MVKITKHFCFSILISLLFAGVSSAADFEFVMDCGASEVYFGQKFVCQFILYSSEDFVDVEVVKFPEFRGFWSENLSLRQGPMGLLAIPGPKGFRKQAIIGSYSVHRMLDKKTSEIIPMKLSVKSRFLSRNSNFGQNEPLLLLSQAVPLKLLPLPPIPVNQKSLPFFGAIGEFATPQQELSVNYRLEEPVQLKIMIQGRGNFAELNTIPLSLPEKTEILSQKSFTQGLGENVSKTFDYSLVFKTPPPKNQSLGSFLFFDPSKRSYRTLQLPTVQFSLAPNPIREELHNVALPEPEEQWTDSQPIVKSMSFWLLQLFLGVLFSSFEIAHWLSKASSRKIASPDHQRKQKWNQALQAHESGDSEKFIRLATVIFTDLLKEKGKPLTLRTSTYPTKKQVLAAAQSNLSNEQFKHIKTLFQQYDHLFSPDETAPKDQSLVKQLSESLKPTR